MSLATPIASPFGHSLAWPRRAAHAVRRFMPVSARKWPFPPQPAPSTQKGNAQAAVMPAAPVQPVAPVKPASRVNTATLGDVRHMTLAEDAVTVRRMLIDIALVAAWAIILPAMLWLGAISGF